MYTPRLSFAAQPWSLRRPTAVLLILFASQATSQDTTTCNAAPEPVPAVSLLALKSELVQTFDTAGLVPVVVSEDTVPQHDAAEGTHSQTLETWAEAARSGIMEALLQASGVRQEQGGRCARDSDCGWHASCVRGGKCEPRAFGERWGVDVPMGIVSFFIAGISLAAGIGGGGLYVPLIMLALSMDARVATALSQTMLLGGAIAAFTYNLRAEHPRVRGLHIIDFELACLIGPALMSGAQLGAIVHAAAPTALLVALLVLVLLDAARKGVRSALKMQASEHARSAAAVADSEPAVLPEEIMSTVLAQSRTAQGWLVLVWMVCLVLIFCKGLLVSICSWKWWFLNLSTSVCMGMFAYVMASELDTREPLSKEFIDFQGLAFPLARSSFLAGIVAALCGIGGGMVMGPILVELKVPPPISSATTATTLLVLSSSTGLVYACRGVIPLNYSIYLTTVTACGALTGKTLVGMWVKRTGNESVIVWCLAGVTLLSVVTMGMLGIVRIVEHGLAAFTFRDFCAQAV